MFGPLKELEEEYINRYSKIFKFLSRLTPDQELIHDIIQDVFLAIIKNPSILKNVRNKNAWFTQLAKNKFIDHIRKKKEISLDSMHFFTSIKSNEMLEISVIQRQEIEDLLSKLNYEEKEFILAKYYYGFSYEEISEITGKSVPSIKLKVFRARKFLIEGRKRNETT